MKIRLALAVLVVLALAATTAYAATVRISEGNFATEDWTRTLVTGAETGQSCNFRTDGTPATQGVHPSPKKSASNQLSWAGLGMNAFDGRKLSTITTFKIRVMGYEGDGTAWEPPSIYIQASKDGLNQRNCRFLPYASYGRSGIGAYTTYDMIGASAKWFNMIDATVKTWSGYLASYPNAQFDSSVTTALPGGKTFNVMDGCAINQEIQYGSSARGTVDWVEIGFAGEEPTVFDFVVPEPGSILALATGLIGFIGLRKRF